MESSTRINQTCCRVSSDLVLGLVLTHDDSLVCMRGICTFLTLRKCGIIKKLTQWAVVDIVKYVGNLLADICNLHVENVKCSDVEWYRNLLIFVYGSFTIFSYH